MKAYSPFVITTFPLLVPATAQYPDKIIYHSQEYDLQRMYAHFQVYVNIGVMDWIRPPENFRDYFRRVVKVGFADPES